jgi:hypothetical protein
MSFKTTVREWFRTDDRPDEDQFLNWFNWTRWNDEKVPLADIEGIDEILNDKADAEALTNHLSDPNAHAEFLSRVQYYELGQMQIFKRYAKNHPDYEPGRQAGDYCIGIIEGQFISADYIGGNLFLLSSYDI